MKRPEEEPIKLGGRSSLPGYTLPDTDYDNYMKVTRAVASEDMIAYHIQQILDRLDIPREWEHAKRTPERFAKMMLELFTVDEFEFTTFDSTSDEMIVLGPIPFYTLCAHHIIPFFGNAWVGYVPSKLVAGLSKLPRLVRNISKGLHVQEELTGLIANRLNLELQPLGVGVVVKAEHLCMAMRGIRQPGVITTTSAMRGVFADHSKTAKAEFLEWVRSSV